MKKSILKTGLILLLVVIAFNLLKSTLTSSSFAESALETLNESLTKVESVKINKPNVYGWSVSGMIRNQSTHNIDGYVDIRFLNSNGDVVHTTKTRVNGGAGIKPNQAAVFEYHADPSKFDGVKNFDVEFHQR